MGRYIKSKAVYSGRNYDVGPWHDHHFVRCSRCGFINNTDRNIHSFDGGYEGWGTTMTTVTSTSGGSGYGGASGHMQTPGPVGITMYMSASNSTDVLINNYGTFSFGQLSGISNSEIFLNGVLTGVSGTLLLLYNGNMYTYSDIGGLIIDYPVTDGSNHIVYDDSAHPIHTENFAEWYEYTGFWTPLPGDPRSGQVYVETIMDAVVGAGCAQCGTMLYNK